MKFTLGHEAWRRVEGGEGGEGRGVVRDKRSVLFTAEPKNKYTYPFFFLWCGGGEGISFVLFPQPSLL